MTGEIINLRLARKRRKRALKQAEADQNRIIHGRSKTDKERDRKHRDEAARHLDGHRRDRDDR